MPHLRLYAVSEQAAENLSEHLIPELAELTHSPLDYFTLQRIPSQFYLKGKPCVGEPQVEVLWFDRGLNIQNKCAKAITNALLAFYPDVDITVTFTSINEKQYYENGAHF